MKEKENNKNDLRGIVIKGAFFVVLVYIMVLVYNLKMASKTPTVSTQQPESTESAK
jgi:hypothetical protein